MIQIRYLHRTTNVNIYIYMFEHIIYTAFTLLFIFSLCIIIFCQSAILPSCSSYFLNTKLRLNK